MFVITLEKYFILFPYMSIPFLGVQKPTLSHFQLFHHTKLIIIIVPCCSLTKDHQELHSRFQSHYEEAVYFLGGWLFYYYSIGIYCTQGWTATKRHSVARKSRRKRWRRYRKAKRTQWQKVLINPSRNVIEVLI